MRVSAEWLHDLRMPLQLIYSCAELIRAEAGDGDAGRHAELLMESVDQLRRMLEDALSRDNPAGEPPKLANVDLVRCLKSLCRRCRPAAGKRGVMLNWGGNVDSLPMALDEDRLSRILLNLIGNALRFTPPGGEIAVTWRAMGDDVEISVRDDGDGIAPDRLPLVFLRGESDGGHGYGLPICQELAHSLGGGLTVDANPGQGSCFTLRLPVRSAMAG